ncbi:RNA 2',3'-cyclic phosphodiesterase [Aliiroseovarius sp. F20344]|uniref:RNA 2',3'-cyclic phosphodiesterase n=1 Tax=Aliiroseovarius sp. F20344 TaxID=2926414 RepID=UPI001FF56E54|nr:RNA 2',3'-cyclic phosphodiesterase [Aliiroseovarius sp. F20344]MCK0142353.1 RNA 2',3'-cyclic phosphodiesterase [Aliiroseovarius sp. F20344]
MRSFLALPLPDLLADELSFFAQRLKLGRPQPPENMHITLAFLDEQPVSVLEDLHEALEATALPAVSVGFAGVDPLGGKIPSVLALRVTGVDTLQARVASVVRGIGITLPHRKFRAHVTLARLPRKPGAEDMAALGHVLETHGNAQFPEAHLREMSLYQSHLRPEGAWYERLADYPLSG